MLTKRGRRVPSFGETLGGNSRAAGGGECSLAGLDLRGNGIGDAGVLDHFDCCVYEAKRAQECLTLRRQAADELSSMHSS